jgi:hypothetical protein
MKSIISSHVFEDGVMVFLYGYTVLCYVFVIDSPIPIVLKHEMGYEPWQSIRETILTRW